MLSLLHFNISFFFFIVLTRPSCAAATFHENRIAMYESIWTSPISYEHAEKVCAGLSSAQCNCGAPLCEINVLATHVRALVLIGIDYKTGNHIIDPKVVPLESKQQALRELFVVENSGNLKVLNAIAGLLREGANQMDGKPTPEDCQRAKDLYLSILKNNSENDEGFRAAACLGDMYRVGEGVLINTLLAAQYYAAAGKYGVQELTDILESNGIKSDYDRLVQLRAQINANRL